MSNSLHMSENWFVSSTPCTIQNANSSVKQTSPVGRFSVVRWTHRRDIALVIHDLLNLLLHLVLSGWCHGGWASEGIPSDPPRSNKLSCQKRNHTVWTSQNGPKMAPKGGTQAQQVCSDVFLVGGSWLFHWMHSGSSRWFSPKQLCPSPEKKLPFQNHSKSWWFELPVFVQKKKHIRCEICKGDRMCVCVCVRQC